MEKRRTIQEIMASLLGALRAGHIPVNGSEVMREIERMAQGDIPNRVNPSTKGIEMVDCTVCENKRYLVAMRQENPPCRAIERCDSCVSELLDDSQAAALARADGISCDSDYPCYVRPDHADEIPQLEGLARLIMAD